MRREGPHKDWGCELGRPLTSFIAPTVENP
jgi:hypothetical protein